MADPVVTPPPLPLADDGGVKAYDRLGGKISIPADKVDELVKMGGRVATREEDAAERTQAAYDKQSAVTKVASIASMAGPVGYPLHAYLRGQGAVLPPELEAYTQGVSSGFTGGAASVGMKELVGAVGGDKAAHAYGQTARDVSEAHPTIRGAGEVAGFVGGAVAGGAGLGAAGKAVPGVGISALGGLAERGALGVAEHLAPAAGRGVIGRALATGGSLGARGAIEGALYGGANQITEDMLGDKDLVADKVFAAMGTGALYGGAGGAVLGAGGSLAASGARGAVSAGRSAIGRALAAPGKVAADIEAKAGGVAAELEGAAGDAAAQANYAARKAATEAENAVRGVADDALASAKGIAEVTGTNAAKEVGAIQSAINKARSPEAQKAVAYRMAWDSMGAGQGLQSTSFAKSAERYLVNGVEDVGELAIRKGVINVEGGVFNAARHGTPADMVPKWEAVRAEIGSKIGDITAASPARIAGDSLEAAVAKVSKKYTESFATKPAGASVQRYGEGLMEHLGVATRDVDGKLVVGGEVSVQDLLRERKAIDTMVFEGVALDPSMQVQIKRELRTELEGLIMDGMDKAGGKLPGALKAEYKALKHDYTAASIGLDAAEDSAARMSKAATFGLTDTLRGGGSIIKTVGSKIVRERGSAAGAVLMYRMAEMGTLTKMIDASTGAVDRASKGILSAPRKAPLPEAPSTEPLRTRAARILDRAAEAQANPEGLASAIAGHTESMTNTPNLAAGLGQRMTTAYAFLASKIPTHPDPDPFDPHPAARMSDAQAATIVRYGAYVERPMRFFDEAAHGKLTYEGVETAKALMPGMFAELQQRTVEGLADMMARGQKPPYAQRERLGILLDIAATPAQRPEHMLLLQSNVATPAQAKKGPQGATAPRRPLSTKSQPSTLDRLEGR